MKRKKWVEGWLAMDGGTSIPRRIVFLRTKIRLVKIKGGWWTSQNISTPLNWWRVGVAEVTYEDLFKKEYGKLSWLKPGTKHLVDLEI